MNAWASRVLGDPGRVRFAVAYADAGTGRVLLTQDARGADLALAPIDLMYLSQVSERGRYPDVEQWLANRFARRRPKRSRNEPPYAS